MTATTPDPGHTRCTHTTPRVGRVPFGLALLFTGLAWCAAPALAADENTPTARVPAASSIPSEAAEPGVPLIDGARERTRRLSERLARRVDSWFGDVPFEQGGKVSQGQLSLSGFHRRDEGSDVALRFTARFRLPNVERRAYLFIGRDDPRDVVRDAPESASAQQQLLNRRSEDRSFLGGLGGGFGEHVSFRVGLRSRFQPFAQARYDLPVQLSPNHLAGFRETIFWTREDGFGSTTALSYEWTLQPQLALRWLGAGTITQETRNVEWSSNLGLYRAFAAQELLSLELLFNGTGMQGNGVGRSDRGLLAKWEQPLYRDWLLGEVALGHFWLRPDAYSPRGRAWGVGGTLKMRF